MSDNEKPRLGRILAVDDENRILAVLKRRLEFAGYTVETAIDGNEGFKKARTGDFDLIILDLILPGLDGYQICSLLKGDRRFRKTPVLMLTARSQEKDIDEGRRVGADAYMTKPYDADALVAKVAELIALARGERTADEREAATPAAPDPVPEPPGHEPRNITK
jgi:DNA-binding response OmpR family regulator